MSNSQTDKKLFSFLGLATKAGKVVSGEFQTETAVKAGTAQIVLIATDASDNTKKLFRDKCSYYKVPMFEFGTKGELGAAIGKEDRSSMAIVDEGFANAVQKKIMEQK